MKSFACLFILIAGIVFQTSHASAASAGLCESLFVASPSLSVNLRQATDNALIVIRSSGSRDLVGAPNDIQILIKPRRFPWQPDVSARLTSDGQKILIVRKADISDTRKKQIFQWNVALALFEAGWAQRLWSSRSVLHAQESIPHDFAKKSISESIHFLLGELPTGAQAQRLNQLKTLQNELYSFFRLLIRSLPMMSCRSAIPVDFGFRVWRISVMDLQTLDPIKPTSLSGVNRPIFSIQNSTSITRVRS